MLASRSAAALAEAAADCQADGASTVLTVPTDVGVAAEVDALFESAEREVGAVDVVVNAAAAVAYGRFDDVPAEVFDRVLRTNLTGTANVSRAALKHFTATGGGHLVLLSSLLGKIAVPLMSPYVTGKWGVQALGRMLQIEARETPGVEVSVITPGSINTPAYYQAGNYVGREGRPPPPVFSADKVATAILRAVRKPSRDRRVGFVNPLIVFGFRAFAPLYDLLVLPLAKIGALSRTAVPTGPGAVFDPIPEGEREQGKWPRPAGG